MNTELNIQDQILLSAYIDGEVTPAEHAQVQTLLQRPEAAAYLQQLKSTRMLVNRHGAQAAPVGLKGRVMAALDEDYDDISRPTASRQDEGKVIALPTASWKTPLLAMAAAVVVALGLFFGPALIPDRNQPSPADIARETTRKAAETDKSGTVESSTATPEPAKPTDTWGEKPGAGPGTGTTEDEERLKAELRALDDATDELGKAGRANDGRSDFARKSAGKDDDRNSVPDAQGLGGGGAGSGTGSGTGGTGEKPGTNAAKIKKEPGRGTDGVLPPSAQPSPAESKPDKGPSDETKDGQSTTEDPNQEGGPARAGGVERRARSEAKGGAANGGAANKEKNDAGPADVHNDPTNEDKKGLKDYEEKLAEGETQSPQADSSRDQRNEDLPVTSISLTLNPGRVLAAQADVLRVAALYGKAALSETDNGDSVVVDLDESRIAELVASLNRLAGQQDYGRVEVPAKYRAAQGNQPEGATARDTLPADAKVQIAGTTPDTALKGPASPARLVIHLK